ERGAPDKHLSSLCQSLFGCEAAILTNNNAAGTLLVLASVAAKKEVIVSRGELVEIGGGFRVPDVIQQGGAKLREVGTTNRTRARDYADAATKKCAAILRVHRSNFEIVGFTESPTVEELREVARAKKLPLLYDEGSGRVVDLAPYGFARGATIRELIAAGVDRVTCSTGKPIRPARGGPVPGRAALGGGTTPAETTPSVAVEVPGNASALYDEFLRRGIVGRIVDDRFTIEVRTLLDDDLPHVTAALRGAVGS